MGRSNSCGPKRSFVFYYDWAEELVNYPDNLKTKIVDAILRYVLYDEQPENPEVKFSMFGLIKRQLQQDNEKWLEVREKRSAAGRKGGLKTQCKSLPENRPLPNSEKNLSPESPEPIEPEETPELQEDEETIDAEDPTPTDDYADDSEEEIIKFEKPSGKSDIDYTELANFFNETLEKEHSIIPRIQKLTGRRRRSVAARCREHGIEAAREVIRKAATSDFLNGKNSNNWTSDFDWIFTSKRFVQILEGKFSNNTNADHLTPFGALYNSQRNTNYNSNYGNNTSAGNNYGDRQHFNNGIPFKGNVNFGCGLIEQ